MELVRILRVLWKRKWWVLIAGIVAVLAGIPVAYRVSTNPLGLHAKRSQYAAASATVLIDRQRSALADVSSDLLALSIRASVYAQFSQSGPVIESAAAAAGLRTSQIATSGPVSGGGGQLPGDAVANQLIGQGSPYRMSFQAADPTVAQIPTLAIYAQAPTPQIAQKMVNGAVAGLRRYINNAAAAQGIFQRNRIAVRQLAPSRGAVVASGVSKSVAVLAAVGVWLVLCLLIVAAPRLREMWRQLALEERAHARPGGQPETAGESDDEAAPSRRRRIRFRRSRPNGSDPLPADPLPVDPLPVDPFPAEPVPAHGAQRGEQPETAGEEDEAPPRRRRILYKRKLTNGFDPIPNGSDPARKAETEPAGADDAQRERQSFTRAIDEVEREAGRSS